MLLHLAPLVGIERARLEQDPVGDADLPDVVEQEAPLEARIVDERGLDLEREPDAVGRDALGVAARAEVARVETRR